VAEDSYQQGLLARIERHRETEQLADRRIRELEAERDRARSHREAAESLYREDFGALRAPIQQDASVAREGPIAAAPALEAGRFTGASWDGAIERVLREAEEPLHVREIWDRLEEGRFRTRAADPLRSVAAIVVRNPRIARAAPNTYVLVPTKEAAVT
jgi:hypothetical protein